MYEVGDGRGARCHYSERASEIPLVTDVTTEDDIVDSGEATASAAPPPATDGPLIRIRSTSKTFHLSGQAIRGLLGVDLDIRAGETVGLVGESGSGKTTLARVLMGIIAPDEGATIQLDGADLDPDARKRRRVRAEGAADRLPEPRLGAQPPPLDQAVDLALAVEARRLQRRRSCTSG